VCAESKQGLGGKVPGNLPCQGWNSAHGELERTWPGSSSIISNAKDYFVLDARPFSFGASFRSTAVFGQSAGSAKDELARSFQWPNGKRMALSLSFDDGRSSQVDTGLALLRRHDVKVTFFLQGNQIEKRLDGWRRAAAEGHEIGNHSMTHPCTGK